MFEIIALEVIDRMRPGANHAHIALEHIQELRQLIDAVFAQEPSYAGNSRIIGDLEGSAVALVQVPEAVLAIIGIGDHGAELEAAELASFAPYAPCAVKDRPLGTEFYGDGSDEHDRRYQNQNR